MSNDIVKASEVNVDELYRVGKMLAISGYFDAKGNSDTAIAQICTKILAGREMGYQPFASVQGIHIIQGRPAVSANLMSAAVKAHPMYDYRVRQMDDKVCSIEFFQRNGDKWESLGTSTFTAEDARKAQTKNMDKFPRNMLFARAMSNGVRWFVPDCFNGNTVYVPEELGATVDGDGNVIDVDYRSVDKATGEVLSTTQPEAPTANGKQNGHAPVEVPPEVTLWEKPDDAYDWAIGIGASENAFAAKNAFKKVVDAHGGRFTTGNAQAIYVAYYHDRMKRAQEKEAMYAATVEDAELFDAAPLPA